MIGGLDGDDSTYCSRAAVTRGSADLALQQVVGLLPKRWPGFGGRGFARVAVGRAVMKVGQRQLVFVKPMPS